MTFENLEIRMMVNDAGIKYKDIAKHMGISRVYLSHLMSYKLSKENEKRIISAINDIKNCIDKETYTSVVVPVEWISCREMFPADGQAVLFTYIDGFDDGSKTFRNIEIGSYDRNQKKWSGAGFLDWQEVIAWMPLPEPYEGD